MNTILYYILIIITVFVVYNFLAMLYVLGLFALMKINGQGFTADRDEKDIEKVVEEKLNNRNYY